MDLTLTAAERAFQEECRAFMQAHAPKQRVPHDDSGAWVAESKQWYRTLHEGRWSVPGWPQRWGGREATPVELMLYEHELAAVRPPRAINTIGTGWAGAALLRHGTPEQQERYLPPIPTADEVWCQLFSEPNAGSDLASLQTRATRQPDGAYRVDGQKVWSSLAMHADRGILLARTDPSAPKHHGISCFVLDMHAPGITIRPIRQITGESDFNEVFLDGVDIPEEDRIGREGEGWTVAITTLMAERIGLSAGEGTLWGTGPTWADVLDLWRRRRDAGLLPPRETAEGAALRDEMARLHIEGEALRLTGLRMLSSVARGGLPAAQMQGGRLANAGLGGVPPIARASAQMSSLRKLASDIWGQQVHEAVWRMLGPHALAAAGEPEAVDDGAWQRAYLFARALTIGGGTTEVQKDIIARRILGL